MIELLFLPNIRTQTSIVLEYNTGLSNINDRTLIFPNIRTQTSIVLEYNTGLSNINDINLICPKYVLDTDK